MSKEQRLALDATVRQGHLDLEADVPTLRSSFEALMAYVPVPEDVGQTPVTLGGVNGLEITVRGTAPSNVVLYLHGGVYVIGSAVTSVALVGDIARRAEVRAFALDYRLGPEHPYPAAVDDVVAAYRGLLDQGFDPANIAFAGDSAGGGLAVAALLALQEAGTPLPSCAYLLSPYADLTLSGESLLAKEAVDPILTPHGLRNRIPDYVDGANAADPHISPVFGDLSGLPPLLIQVGSNEILLSDALRLAARAATDDVPVTLEVTPGVPHVFQAYAAVLDEAAVALDRAAAFLRGQFADAQPAEREIP